MAEREIFHGCQYTLSVKRQEAKTQIASVRKYWRRNRPSMCTIQSSVPRRVWQGYLTGLAKVDRESLYTPRGCGDDA
jgi:hypothetical protein